MRIDLDVPVLSYSIDGGHLDKFPDVIFKCAWYVLSTSLDHQIRFPWSLFTGDFRNNPSGPPFSHFFLKPLVWLTAVLPHIPIYVISTRQSFSVLYKILVCIITSRRLDIKPYFHIDFIFWAKRKVRAKCILNFPQAQLHKNSTGSAVF